MSVRRLAHAHDPLTLLEIGLVTVVLGVAAAVAVPEYLHLRQDANDDAAKTRLAQSARKLELHLASAGASLRGLAVVRRPRPDHPRLLLRRDDRRQPRMACPPGREALVRHLPQN